LITPANSVDNAAMPASKLDSTLDNMRTILSDVDSR
jgi:hypothetical protein